MSQKIEAKQAKLQDSNVFGIKSSDDIAQRVKAARSEKEYEGAGKKVGLEIWRIEKLNVKKWPKELYGKFYDGDSYIVLNTFIGKTSKKMHWDLHFWLGTKTTQDEQCVAAYKTVELDDLLNQEPVQHREVMGFESDLFLSYFSNSIMILSGGIESGFRVYKPEEFKPRLFRIFGKRRIEVLQVPVSWKSLNTGDAFVLDMGQKLYAWIPKDASKTEKFRASQVLKSIQGERKGQQEEFYLDEEGDENFWKALGGKGKLADPVIGADEALDKMGEKAKALIRVSDETGKFQFEKIEEGKLSKKSLNSKDVFIIDTGKNIICYIGNESSSGEKLKAMMFASGYAASSKKPSWVPLTRIFEGQANSYIDSLFSN